MDAVSGALRHCDKQTGYVHVSLFYVTSIVPATSGRKKPTSQVALPRRVEHNRVTSIASVGLARPLCILV